MSNSKQREEKEGKLIELAMQEAFHKLDIAHNYFDDEMSPDCQIIRANIIQKCRAILKEHGDLG